MNRALEAIFPGLAAGGYRITSPESAHYNCIAWAAGLSTIWWWPDPFGIYYWPDEVARVETLEAFLHAYRLLGYEICEAGDLEPGHEKVAIYLDAHGVPTHAARQLPSGAWTSKLGSLEDVEHSSPAALFGTAYGNAVRLLKRRRPPAI